MTSEKGASFHSTFPVLLSVTSRDNEEDYKLKYLLEVETSQPLNHPDFSLPT